MKLRIIATGEIEDYDYSYAARLIEQGKAVLAPAPAPQKAETPSYKWQAQKPKAETAKKDAEAPVPDGKAAKAGKEEAKAGDQ